MDIKCPKCGKAVSGAKPGAACPHCGAALGPDSSGETVALTPGQMKKAGLGGTPSRRTTTSYRHIIKGYELLKKLGEGGMGGVFLARQKSTGEKVALKVLRRELSRDRDYVTRLMREAKLASDLDHPNIIRAFETGESNGYYYMAMDYVEGKSLHDVLKTRGALPEKESLGIVAQVARALAYAHLQGIVHRDVKPDNVMITAGGAVKLADLGLAKQVDSQTALTQTGTTMGTPDYMSPEQARGEGDIDIRSDIYSLGATLFHLVTGKPPFEGSSAGVVIAKRLTEVPPTPSEIKTGISAACDRLVNRMIAPHRDDRHQTPQELVIDIERAMSGDRRAGRSATGAKPRRRPTAAAGQGLDQLLAKARSRYLAGDLPGAQEIFTAVADEKPTCREAWVGRVLTLMELHKYEESWKWADQALKMFQNDSELLGAKSLVQRKLGQEQYSRQLCDSAVREGGTGLAWLSRGVNLLAAGSAEAAQCFTKAVARSRDRELMHIRVARCCLEHGKDREALSELRLASAALPESALVHFLLGAAQEGLKMAAPARDAYRRAAELAPDNQQYAAAAKSSGASAGGKIAGFLKRKFKK